MFLTEFCSDYAAWLDAGAPEGAPFSRSQGLTFNFEHWLATVKDLAPEQSYRAKDAQLGAAFVEEGLNWEHPFHEDPESAAEEAQAGLAHTNEARNAWVRAHI